MPHKRNPVLSENLTGLARMVRSYALPAMENVALWHERDISHSSVERMIGPDATVTLDFALARLTGLIDKLLVYPENMQKNLDKLGGLVHSQRVLIALTQKGVPREDAYRLVQRNAMKVWRGESNDFLGLLKADPDVRAKRSATRSSRPISTSAITSSTSIRSSSGSSADDGTGFRKRMRLTAHARRIRFPHPAGPGQFRRRPLAVLLVPGVPQRHRACCRTNGTRRFCPVAFAARRRDCRRHAAGGADLPQSLLLARRALGGAQRQGPRRRSLYRRAGRCGIRRSHARSRRAVSRRSRARRFRCRRWWSQAPTTLTSPSSARGFAESWGADLCNAGELGHINSESKLGFWPQGLLMLGQLLARVES